MVSFLETGDPQRVWNGCTLIGVEESEFGPRITAQLLPVQEELFGWLLGVPATSRPQLHNNLHNNHTVAPEITTLPGWPTTNTNG